MILERGAFIVLEGCDRSGKTTLCNNLVSLLNDKEISAEYMSFPDRSTTVGKIIDDYLSKRVEMNDRAVHLLFSANRWEIEPIIRNHIKEGTTLIVDRYSYSGVVYSSVKPGMDYDWCKNPEAGLPKPDLIIYLTLSEEEIALRQGFGAERYENREIQTAVAERFKLMQDSQWKVIEANRPVDELSEELFKLVTETISRVKETPINDLW